MNLLLDTQILIWASDDAAPVEAVRLITDPANTLYFSAASIWEVAIKASLGRPDFQTDPHLLRRGLIDNGYLEIPITGEHAAAVRMLPLLHRDPFDRLLIAQATVEGMTLLTADLRLGDYPGPIRVFA